MAERLNSPWPLNNSKWMHESGIGSTDPRHKVDYWRIESITPAHS